MSLDLTLQRLESSRDRVNTFIDQNIFRWAMEKVLLPAQENVRATISEKAGRALQLEKTGFMKVDLTWDLRGDNGEPLHFYLEFGTDPHKIRPKGKDHGGADVLHWKGPSGGFVIGADFFAHEVNHPGSKKHVGLIQGIKDERMPDLRDKIISETKNKMETDQI